MTQEWRRLTDRTWIDAAAVQSIEKRTFRAELRFDGIDYYVLHFYGGAKLEFWGDDDKGAIAEWLAEKGLRGES